MEQPRTLGGPRLLDSYAESHESSVRLDQPVPPPPLLRIVGHLLGSSVAALVDMHSELRRSKSGTVCTICMRDIRAAHGQQLGLGLRGN